MASHAARLVLLLAVAAALAGRSAEGAWCVCRTDLPDATLQRTLDYACGSAADCKPIQPSAACFAPDNVKAHCSYAVNSFYQRSGQNPLACVFSGTAALSSIDPSTNSCKYPASATPSAPDSPPPPMAQGPNGPPKDTSGGADVLPVAGTAVLPEQRPLLTGAEVLLPEAPQAQVFHLQPQNYSAVASGPAVASTLLLALIFFLMA